MNAIPDGHDSAIKDRGGGDDNDFINVARKRGRTGNERENKK